MRRISFTVISLFTYLPLLAQLAVDAGSYVDSLSQLLKTGATDSVKARAAYLLSDHWSYTDTAKARQYLDLGSNLSKATPYLVALRTYYEAGLAFDHRVEEAKQLYQEAADRFSRFPTTESYIFQAKCWHNYGALLQRQDNSEGFLAALLDKAIPLAEKSEDAALVAGYFTDVGMILCNEAFHDKAATYFNKSLAYYENHDAPLAAHLMTLLTAAKNYVLATDLSAAEPLLQKAADLLKPYPQSVYNIDLAEVESMYYKAATNYQAATASLNKGIALAGKLNQRYLLSALFFQLYQIHFDRGNYRLAQEALQKAIDTEPHQLSNNSEIFARNMSLVLEKMGNYKEAYAWLQKRNAVNDSLNNNSLKSRISELESRFQFAENEKKIAALQAEREQALLAQKNQRLLNLLLGAGAIVLVLIIIFLMYIHRIGEKQARQRLQDIAQKQELKLTQAMLEGEERERARIARDLHDGLGGTLSGIKFNLSAQADASVSHAASHIVWQLDDAIGELRRIARNMMPEGLVRSGLEVALRDLCVSFSTAATTVEFQTNGICRNIPIAAQLNIYRIVQELLTNAVRHGKATEIIVQCLQNDRVTGTTHAPAQERAGAAQPTIGVCTSIEQQSKAGSAGFDFIIPGVADYLMPTSPSAAQSPAIAACNMFFPSQLKCVGPEADLDTLLTYAETVFKEAHRRNVPIIIFGSGGARNIPDGYDRTAAVTQFTELCIRLAERAARYNIKIALENLNKEETNLVNTVASALTICKAVNMPNFGINADIYHMLKEQEPPERLLDARGRIFNCDIAEPTDRTPPGTEGTDFTPYLSALRATGYQGGIAVEARWKDFSTQAATACRTLRAQLDQVQ